jgi:RNA polymerase sigma factor (sigma-70 family)
MESLTNRAISPPAPQPTLPEFGIFYTDTYAEMVNLARALGSGPDAEDLVQDCYTRLYRRYYTLTDPRTYLRRCIINGRRSWLRRPHHRLASQAPLPDSPAPSSPDLVEDKDLLWTALPRNQHAALVLRYYLDLPDTAIAPALGVKVGTVASLIHRGLANLRPTLATSTPTTQKADPHD